MIYFEASWIRIHWDDSITGVWAEWLNYAEGSEFRLGLNKGLELLEKQGSQWWLADTRNLGAVRQDDQQWSNEDWFPRAIKGGVRWMALIVPRKVVAQMAVKRVMSKVGNAELSANRNHRQEEECTEFNKG